MRRACDVLRRCAATMPCTPKRAPLLLLLPLAMAMVGACAAAKPPTQPASGDRAVARPDYTLEKAHKGLCPTTEEQRLSSVSDLLTGACEGPMPAPLAKLLRAIPERDIHLPVAWREQRLRSDVAFKAVPDSGQGPAWMAVMDDIWIRSLPGRSATDTYFLVGAPFECVDGTALDPDEAEPVDLEAGACKQAYISQRVYRVQGEGAPVDVTAATVPAPPALPAAGAAGGDYLKADRSRLQYVPVLRWSKETSEAPKTRDPRGFSQWGQVHLGFDVWTGARFERRDTVTARQWPCRPAQHGQPACSAIGDAGQDPFVVADGPARAQGTTP